MRVRELRFQILDATLQRLRFTAGSGLAAAIAGTAAGTRRHETQVAAGCGVAVAAPGIHLTMHFTHRLGLVQRRDFVAARHAQHSTAPQDIDVAAECLGIRAVHGDHGLIDVASR